MPELNEYMIQKNNITILMQNEKKERINPFLSSLNRLPEFDLLKAVAIFLVIWQHCIYVCGYGHDMIETFPGRIITSVNMPLFMFIVGVFSISSLQKGWIVMFKSKWNSILVPTFLFCTIQLLMSIDYNKLLHSGLSGGGKYFVFTFISPYWFIWALMFSIVWLKFFMWITSRWSSKNFYFPCIISLITVLLIPRTIHVPFFMYSQSMYAFFVSGVIFSQYKSRITINKKSVYIILTLIAIYIPLLFFIQKERSFYYFTLISDYDYFLSYILMLISGLSGIVICYILAKYAILVKKRFVILEFVGQYTLSIYLMQGVLCLIGTKYNPHITNLYFDFIIAVAVFAILSAMCKIFTLNTLTSRLILGKTK